MTDKDLDYCLMRIVELEDQIEALQSRTVSLVDEERRSRVQLDNLREHMAYMTERMESLAMQLKLLLPGAARVQNIERASDSEPWSRCAVCQRPTNASRLPGAVFLWACTSCDKCYCDEHEAEHLATHGGEAA